MRIVVLFQQERSIVKIIIGSDHRGVELKKQIMTDFDAHEWHDVGAYVAERTDYPIYAKQVCSMITNGDSSFGLLICGSGVGMAIAANRTPGIYAALCWSEEIARIAYRDDGVNVLVLGADVIPPAQNSAIVAAMIQSWEENSFKGGQYLARLRMIDV